MVVPMAAMRAARLRVNDDVDFVISSRVIGLDYCLLFDGAKVIHVCAKTRRI